MKVSRSGRLFSMRKSICFSAPYTFFDIISQDCTLGGAQYVSVCGLSRMFAKYA